LAVEPFDEHGQGICAHVPNGLCNTVIWVTRRPFSIQYLKPDAQSLSLINRLPLAHRLPRNYASQHHQQDGERDVNPLYHGVIMSRWGRKSKELACYRPKPAPITGD
jgi:hypothetical protein